MPLETALPDPDDLARSARSLLSAGRPGAARPLIAALRRMAPERDGLALLESELAAAEGRIPDAIAALGAAINARPGEADSLKRRAGLLFQAGDAEAAIRDAADAVIAAPGDAAAKALLGVLLLEKGDSSAALACLGEAVAADPDNADFRLGCAEAARRSGDAARAALLLGEGIAAGDRVPGLMRAAVLAGMHLPPAGRVGPVLDLGCGSGMVAVALSDLALGPFIGLDPSPAMLSAAREWGLYAELVEADPAAFLGTEERHFPLILAADVLSRFGPLSPVFSAVRSRLAPGGRFICSLEAMSAEPSDERGWKLRTDGRYAHQAAFCEFSAREAGFRVVDLAAETLRFENGMPVAGLLAVLARADDAG